MALMQGQKLSLNMGDLVSFGVCNVGFIVQGGELRPGTVDDVFPVVGDIRFLVQGENFRGCEQGTDRLAVFLYIVDVGFLPGFTEPEIL